MKPMIWAHADCLSLTASPFRKFPHAASVFVMDPEQIDANEIGLMRIGFLYETALDLGCEVRRGDTTSELLWAARAGGCDTIVTADSADPGFRRVCDELRKSVKLEILPADSANAHDGIDPRQFAGYWKKSNPEFLPRV
jgi:hypothetical protein